MSIYYKKNNSVLCGTLKVNCPFIALASMELLWRRVSLMQLLDAIQSYAMIKLLFFRHLLFLCI